MCIREAGASLSEAALYTSVVFSCNILAKLTIGPLYDGPHGGPHVHTRSMCSMCSMLLAIGPLYDGPYGGPTT